MVAPNIYMVSPILVKEIDRIKLRVTRPKVATTFYLKVNFTFLGKNSYSKVSLHGRRVRGVAKKITN